MRINHVLAQKSHPITSLNWGTWMAVPVCLYSPAYFSWWWLKSNVFSVYRFEYSCCKATRFLNMDVISKDGPPLELRSRSTCLWEWTVCDWCWAGPLPSWIILSWRGTDLKGTKAYGVTGCNSAVEVTDFFLEKDRVPRFYFLFVGDVSGNLCEKVPLELRPEGRGRACWRDGGTPWQQEGLLREGSSGRLKELK